MITFACPSCSYQLKVKDDLAGKKGKCPQCKQPIAVPDGVANPARTVNDGAEPDLRTLAPHATQPGVGPRDSDTVVPEGRSGAVSDPDTLAFAVGPAHKTSSELYDFLAPPQAADELGRLGSYRVLKVLGAGGMGVVFQAEDPQLKRQVALKAMLPTLAVSESARKRFVREAQAAAAISHDHIVQIYQVGQDRGVPFIAMQFLEGEPLEERVRRQGKLSVAQVLRIGRETAEGLAAAHRRDMIHRDIKPANLWLEGGSARVKILDFGLARAASDESHLTQQGSIVGTPSYMAPEQAAGDPVDHRCDLFSLGCVLYRLCTGKLPFKGSDAISTLLAVRMDHPAPPDAVNPEVPAGLSDLVLRLLAKEPADRPQSAEAVAEALRTLESDPTAELSRVGRRRTAHSKSEVDRSEHPRKKHGKRHESRSQTFWQRRWPLVVVGMGTVMALGVVGVLVLTGAFGGKAPQPGPPAQDGKVANQDQSVKDASVKNVLPTKSDEAALNRKAAEFAIRQGGAVTVASLKGGSVSEPITEVAALPQKPFWVNGVELPNRGITDDVLENLQGLTELERLSLPGNPLRGAGLQFLKDASKLRELDLTKSEITDAGLEQLKPLKSLETLNLADTHVSNLGLEHLQGLNRLQDLTLSGTRVTESGLGALHNLQQLSLLRLLGLGNAISEESVQRLKKTLPACQVITERTVIERVTQLRGYVGVGDISHHMKRHVMQVKGVDKLPPGPLNIVQITIPFSGTPISEVDLKLISGVSHLKALELPYVKSPPTGLATLRNLKELVILVLPRAQIADGKLQPLEGMKNLQMLILEGVQVPEGEFKVLGKLKNLEIAFLMNSSITDADLAHFKGLGQMFTLNLAQTQIGDQGLESIAGMSRLRFLYLGNSRVTGAGLVHLKKLNSLVSVWLDNLPVGDADLPHLKELPNLSMLGLSQTKVTDAGLEHLGTMTNLATLILAQTMVTDAGLKHLKGLTNLNSLTLSQTMITDAGLVHLRDLTSLTYLGLSKTMIADAGLAHLKGLPNLNTLELEGTKVTDACVDHLIEMTNLTTLTIKQTNITNAGIKRLKAAFPKGSITTK